jgi:hypothetical protein
MKLDEAKIEARAKIIWGESPEKVFVFLQENGFSDKDAYSLLSELKKERASDIRSSGVKKITIGALLVPIPFIAYLFFMCVGYIYIKIMAGTGLFGVFGAWKIIEGISMIVAPSSERGDLSNISE